MPFTFWVRSALGLWRSSAPAVDSKTAKSSKEGLLEETGYGSDGIAEPNIWIVVAIGVTVAVGVAIGVYAIGVNIKAEIDKHSPPHEQAIIMDESGLIKIS